MQIQKHKSSRVKGDGVFAAEFNLAVEELLEIYIDDSPYAITMRLPGDDINLTAGFCFTEGIIESREDLASIKHCDVVSGERRVLVCLNRQGPAFSGGRRERPEYVSRSSCGVCGKSCADEIYGDMVPVEGFHRLTPNDLLALRGLFESRQAVFPLTGATHSASIFDFERRLLAFSEDIGRHNAFDKAIGSLLREGKIHEAFLAIVSSRLSFEMLQKAGVLGVEILAGLSAPTSMAVDMADRLNITLVGFLREGGMSIYTHPGRILGQGRGDP